MQSTSSTYQDILRNGLHQTRHRVYVAGIEYTEDDILTDIEIPVSLSQPPMVQASLFAKSRPRVGDCVSRQLDLLLRLKEQPPRMSEIRLETQLVLQDPITGEITAESEWISKGTYYIDTRRPIDLGDTAAPMGAILIHGYDAMLKAEQPYLGSTITDSWPQKAPVVAAAIAQRLGLTLDSRSVIAEDDVPLPLELTMREVLSDIAAANAGNWTVTDTGALRLVPLRSIPSATGYLVTEDGDAITLGSVRLVVSADTDTSGAADGQQTYVGAAAQALEVSPALPAYTGVTLEDADGVQYSAGDGTGMVLTAYCGWATQAMAERVLAAVEGYAYRPFSAASAILDPAAELGDGVTVGGVYSVLAASTATFDGLLHADISAPAEEELDHEYPYETPEQRSMKRGFKQVYSTIEKTDTAIRMEVGELSGKYAALALTVDGFTVTDDSGTTRIKGSSIETDTLHVKAANIDGTLTAQQINLTGSISWADLDSGVQSDISSAGYSKSQIKTFINESLVASPNIAGATFYDLSDTGDLADSMAYLQLHAEMYGSNVGPVLRYVDNQNGHDIFRLWSYNKHCYMGLCGGFGWVCSPTETDEDAEGLSCQVYTALGTHAFQDKVRFEYEVDFSGATVTGLDVTATAVWG